MIMLLLIAAIARYHTTAHVSRGQIYYKKAVQKAWAELEKLKVFFQLQYDPSNPNAVPEFKITGLPSPDELFLFRYNQGQMEVPDQIHNLYYNQYTFDTTFLRAMANKNTIKDYHTDYETTYKNSASLISDLVDIRTFTYFTYNNGDAVTNYNTSAEQLDTAIVVIDDMVNPSEPEDDLIGYIGWWVENIDNAAFQNNARHVTFALQFWYPGQDMYDQAPEVILLKTLMVKE